MLPGFRFVLAEFKSTGPYTFNKQQLPNRKSTNFPSFHNSAGIFFHQPARGSSAHCGGCDLSGQ
jgi:hypothetical protein